MGLVKIYLEINYFSSTKLECLNGESFFTTESTEDLAPALALAPKVPVPLVPLVV